MSRVEVLPPAVTVEIGGTTPLSATTKDFAGRTLGGRPVVWSSLNESVARVNASTGEVTGIAQGTSTISATAEGVAGTAQVTVSAIAVASIDVTRGSGSLIRGALSC